MISTPSSSTSPASIEAAPTLQSQQSSQETAVKPQVRAGFLTFLGLPNAGKSSLLNKLMGEYLAIVSPKEQTTWQTLRAYLVRDGLELVLIDTPGIQEGTKALNQILAKNTFQALNSASEGNELVAFVIDTAQMGRALKSKNNAQPDFEKLSKVFAKSLNAKLPIPLTVIPVLNKSDLVRKKEFRDEIEQKTIEGMKQIFSNVLPPHWVNAAASTEDHSDGLESLLKTVQDLLPLSNAGELFDEESLTDRPMREIAAEFIREQCFYQLSDEIPYSIAVTIDKFEEEKADCVRIEAVLHVEKESQKGIVIGKQASKIKSIGTKSRQKLEILMKRKMFLGLKVKVTPSWTKQNQWVKRFGYEL